LKKRQRYIDDGKGYLYKKEILMNEIQPYNQTDLFNKVASLLNEARKSVVQTVNKTMVYTYFEIGRMIVEEEQNGKERAEYGKQILKELSKRLNAEFGKGFSQRNLEQMRQFYLTYSKAQTLSAEFNLSWSHYLKLMRIDNEDERNYYEIEAYNNNWSLRELQRQFDSALYERLVLSRDKKAVKELSEKGQVIENPKDSKPSGMSILPENNILLKACA